MNSVLSDRIELEPKFSQRPILVDALATLMQQLVQLLETLTDQQYTQAPVGTITSSVGSHVRHCLDHVRELIDGVQSGEMNFDARKRGTTVESCRHTAIAECRKLSLRLETLTAESLDEDVRLALLPSADAEAIVVRTCAAREAAYVLSHTIHHNAIIAAAVKTLGVTPPDRFGYAPSTLAAQKDGRCAR